MADPKIKWKRISDFVSARAPCRRSPKECASRFLECRRAVLSEKQATSEASFPTHDDDVSAGVKSPGDHPACFSTCATPNDKANFRLEEKKETHRDAQLKWIIELENLMLQRVQLFFLATLRSSDGRVPPVFVSIIYLLLFAVGSNSLVLGAVRLPQRL